MQAYKTPIRRLEVLLVRSWQIVKSHQRTLRLVLMLSNDLPRSCKAFSTKCATNVPTEVTSLPEVRTGMSWWRRRLTAQPSLWRCRRSTEAACSAHARAQSLRLGCAIDCSP